MDSATLNKALDRLRAASLDASKGTAYTCGPPWFRHGSGILVGSPDPHAGQMIADTDTSVLDPDNHAEIDDDCNAIFLAEAWNFARMLLGSPALLDALRSTGTGRSEAEARKGLALAYDLIREKYARWSPEAGTTWPAGVAPAVNALCSLIDGDGFLQPLRAIPAQAAGGGDA